MLDLLPLPVQVAQRTCTNLLRLKRHTLRRGESPGRPLQPIGACEQLLTLLELGICVGIIGVAVAEEFTAVVGVGFEFSLGAVEVVFEVAEARVVLGFEVCGEVGLFETHLANLCGALLAIVLRAVFQGLAIRRLIQTVFIWPVASNCSKPDSPAHLPLPAPSLPY